jgi:hypothetical protein
MSIVRHLGAVALGALLLAGCQTSGPEVTPGLGADLAGARRLLLVQGVDGPIPVVVDRVPAVLGGPAAEQDIATLASRAVSWSTTSFAPAPADPARPGAQLLLRFGESGASPEQVCAGRAPAEGNPDATPAHLHAVFCKGQAPIADAFGVAGGTDRAAAEQLVTRTTARLFPDYSSGGGGFPGISIFGGVGVGSGGSSGAGVGIGLGF